MERRGGRSFFLAIATLLSLFVFPSEASHSSSHYRSISLEGGCPIFPKALGKHPTFIRLPPGSSVGSRCILHVTTRPNYGLAVFVEQMDLNCAEDEYLRFNATIPGYWKPTKVFSDALCGRVNATGRDFLVEGTEGLRQWQFFNESSAELKIEFSVGFAGSFLLVATPTLADCTGRGDRFARCGAGYCVPSSVLCDGHINCMERPGYEASDELVRQCLANGDGPPAHLLSLCNTSSSSRAGALINFRSALQTRLAGPSLSAWSSASPFWPRSPCSTSSSARLSARRRMKCGRRWGTTWSSPVQTRSALAALATSEWTASAANGSETESWPERPPIRGPPPENLRR